MKVFITILISIILATQSSGQITVNCYVGPVSYVYFGFLNSCKVNINPYITNPATFLTGTTGGAATNVRVFYGLLKVIQYIPKNMPAVFPSLTGIRLESTQLKTVTGCDLAPFGTALTMFASVGNDVEFLEPNLFTNNPNIEYVSFRDNKISYIDPVTFNNLNSLNQLYLYNQKVWCLLGNSLTRNQVLNAIASIPGSKCANPANKPWAYIMWETVGFPCI